MGTAPGEERLVQWGGRLALIDARDGGEIGMKCRGDGWEGN